MGWFPKFPEEIELCPTHFLCFLKTNGGKWAPQGSGHSPKADRAQAVFRQQFQAEGGISGAVLCRARSCTW